MGGSGDWSASAGDSSSLYEIGSGNVAGVGDLARFVRCAVAADDASGCTPATKALPVETSQKCPRKGRPCNLHPNPENSRNLHPQVEVSMKGTGQCLRVPSACPVPLEGTTQPSRAPGGQVN